MFNRTIVLFAAFSILLITIPAKAQNAGTVHRIGYLTVHSQTQEKSFYPSFVRGLEELGYVEGKNVIIEKRYANGDNSHPPGLAKDLLSKKVNLFVTGGAGAARAVQQLTKTIPIVMAEAAGPIQAGLISSYSHPGGNVTGDAAWTPENFRTFLDLIKETIPSADRVGVIWNPNGPASTLAWKSLSEPAQKLGLKLDSMEVRGTGDLKKAFQNAQADQVRAVYVTPGPRVSRNAIIDLVLKDRMPLFAGPGYSKRGGLVLYGHRTDALYHRAAYFVDKIFKGAKPGDLPVELPSKINLIINLKTAKAIGVTVPTSLLSRATKVIK